MKVYRLLCVILLLFTLSFPASAEPYTFEDDLGMPGERISPIQTVDAESGQSYFTTVLIKPAH